LIQKQCKNINFFWKTREKEGFYKKLSKKIIQYIDKLKILITFAPQKIL
jgi:hypothetical protein